MKRRFAPTARPIAVALVLTFACSVMCGAVAFAAPRIDRLSLRGLQAGGITTLVIEGAELASPQIVFNCPQAKHVIKDGATAERIEVEFTLEAACESGIYLLRVASPTGISEPVALGVDNLPQLAFIEKLAAPQVALSGALSGSNVLSTKFTGKQGQQLVVEVESRRLGSKLNPSVHVYDHRHAQLAWSRPLAALSGDARCSLALPADGEYSIELHDDVFRGEEPGFFRLKIGDFHYADVAYPLGAQQGVATNFQYASTNFPAEAQAAATLAVSDGLAREREPAPWPPGVPLLSGSRPAVIVTSHAEVLEAPPTDKPQEIVAAPVAINGRISAAGEQDRYRLAVTPGQTLRFDVLARRAGSALDGVLSIQNEQGGELAASDDRPGTSDPGLDFKIPEGVNAVLVVVRDLRSQGGRDFVYRVLATPVGTPDFTVTIPADRVHVPKDGAALVRVEVARAGYPGPIKLDFPNLPPSVSITGNEIPARATSALVSLGAPGLNPVHSLSRVLATSANEKVAISKLASLPQSNVTKHQPWLGDELAIAVTGPAPISLAWDLFASDAKLAQATSLPMKLRVVRAEGVQGPVRLSLMTTQKPPRKKINENNQEKEVDDVERTLRFDAQPTIAADQSEVAVNIIVPGDLPRIDYDLAIQAELLSADSKSVVATVVTPARRLGTVAPLRLELAADQVEARAGAGPTGSVSGKIHRAGGFALPVNVTLSGLPEGVSAPTITLTGDQSDFSFPLVFPYGAAAGEVANVKLTAVSLTNPKDPKSTFTVGELPLKVSVVPGDKPPVQPLAVFEDQPEFIAALVEGGGTAALHSEEKYSGAGSAKITPDQKYAGSLPGLGVKIRENPGPGEYRYLRFAWKKQGGKAICLQLNHDGSWGPQEGKPASFRYHSGPAGPCYGASLAIDAAVPEQFEVVTRDLFADFGEFTLTGLALSPVDGEFGLFDHIYLGTTVDDFKLVKP